MQPGSHVIKERFMDWVRPDFEEISLGCEINSYANPEL